MYFSVGLSFVKNTLTALPRTIPLKIMGSFTGFPKINSVGQMYVGKVTDKQFRTADIITWKNIKGRPGGMQWLGWQSRIFADETLRISFWIKFVDRVPKMSWNFGIKVYGALYNDFVHKCVRDKWCYVEETVKCRNSGDGNHVLLIFDSISHLQTVRISKLQVQVLQGNFNFTYKYTYEWAYDVIINGVGMML